MNTSNTKEEETCIQAQRENFVASLSHDLKNPTIAQIRALELFLKGSFGQIPPKQREILEMVLDSCKYMNAMLASLLTTYKYDKGSIKLSNDDISMLDLAQECVEEVMYLAKDKEVSIEVKNMAKEVQFFGDKVQLKRVVMNLMSNGIKYAYKNSKIIIKVYNEGKYTCYSLENRSTYMNPEKCKKIFAKYVSFASAHKEYGIGLGLYASKKIVEAHEGIIFVESFKDERNIFGFKIPNDKSYKDKERVVVF